MNQIVNHIAILLDRSSSMRPLAAGVMKQYNDQAKRITQRSAETGQKTHFSLYTFATQADQPILVEVPLDLVDLKPLDGKTYVTDGWTAMLDCIGLAADQLSRFERGSDDSFLIIVITDGEENRSKEHSWRSVSQLVKTKTATDAWTFVFLVPVGAKQKLVSNLNAYDGNVQEWDQTDKGVEEYSRSTNRGLDAYFVARASGKRSVKSFFTDLSKVSTRDVSSALVEMTGNFQKEVVADADCNTEDQHGNKAAVIQEYCVAHFGQYVIGSAYYSLTKREKVQDHKSFVIEDRATGKMYGGPQAREMLGFPSVGEVSVAPGDHGNFHLYVKSTSVNRKLIRGTTVLYYKVAR